MINSNQRELGDERCLWLRKLIRCLEPMRTLMVLHQRHAASERGTLIEFAELVDSAGIVRECGTLRYGDAF